MGLRVRGHLPHADSLTSADLRSGPAPQELRGQRLERADHGQRLPLSEQVAGQRVHVVEDVTLDDVNTLARNLFRQGQTLAVVGPFEALPA